MNSKMQIHSGVHSTLEAKKYVKKAKWILKQQTEKIYIGDDMTMMKRNIEKKLQDIKRQQHSSNWISEN